MPSPSPWLAEACCLLVTTLLGIGLAIHPADYRRPHAPPDDRGLPYLKQVRSYVRPQIKFTRELLANFTHVRNNTRVFIIEIIGPVNKRVGPTQ